MNSVSFRLDRAADLEAIKRLTINSFSGVTIEENLEASLGVLNGHEWRWRKARHLDEDPATNPSGIFVAEAQGQLAGYIATRIDREAGKGRIPNLAVEAAFRGQGLGRLLLERALEYFRAEGLVYAVIETMAQNAVGQHLYARLGRCGYPLLVVLGNADTLVLRCIEALEYEVMVVLVAAHNPPQVCSHSCSWAWIVSFTS